MQAISTPHPAPTELPRSSALAERLRDEVDGHPILSPSKFIDMMGLDVGAFAAHAHVHRNTVTRAPASASVQGHIRSNLRVLSAAMATSGGDLARAIFWYKNEPLAPFVYKTAEALVAEGRADDVINLLESYQAGFIG